MLSTVDTLKQLNYNLDSYIKYSVFRQYEYNMSSKDLLDKYATTDDQKQTLELQVLSKLSMVKLSDYNEMRNLKGETSIDLKNDEVLISSNYDPLKEILEGFIRKENSIKIGDKQFTIKEKKIETEAFSTSSTSDNMFALIVPDNLVRGWNHQKKF